MESGTQLPAGVPCSPWAAAGTPGQHLRRWCPICLWLVIIKTMPGVLYKQKASPRVLLVGIRAHHGHSPSVKQAASLHQSC